MQLSAPTDSPTDSALRSRGCFDPALSEFPTQMVPIGAVVDLLQLTHAPDRIAEYRLAMESGARFPPVSVVKLGRWFFVADGHKRFSAYTSLPVDAIMVEVWPFHRWLADQWRQFRRKTLQQVRVLWFSPVDPRARAQAVQLFRDTLRHWRRVYRSLRSRLRAVPRDRSGSQ